MPRPTHQFHTTPARPDPGHSPVTEQRGPVELKATSTRFDHPRLHEDRPQYLDGYLVMQMAISPPKHDTRTFHLLSSSLAKFEPPHLSRARWRHAGHKQWRYGWKILRRGPRGGQVRRMYVASRRDATTRHSPVQERRQLVPERLAQERGVPL